MRSGAVPPGRPRNRAPEIPAYIRAAAGDRRRLSGDSAIVSGTAPSAMQKAWTVTGADADGTVGARSCHRVSARPAIGPPLGRGRGLGRRDEARRCRPHRRRRPAAPPGPRRCTSSECPPRSKKSSSTPTSAGPKVSANSPHSRCGGVRGRRPAEPSLLRSRQRRAVERAVGVQRLLRRRHERRRHHGGGQGRRVRRVLARRDGGLRHAGMLRAASISPGSPRKRRSAPARPRAQVLDRAVEPPAGQAGRRRTARRSGPACRGSRGEGGLARYSPPTALGGGNRGDASRT